MSQHLFVHPALNFRVARHWPSWLAQNHSLVSCERNKLPFEPSWSSDSNSPTPRDLQTSMSANQKIDLQNFQFPMQCARRFYALKDRDEILRRNAQLVHRIDDVADTCRFIHHDDFL